MAEVVPFHHAQGLTPGVLAFAERLRAAGHAVHAPDLYDGKTFTNLDDGVGYAKEVGFDTIMERGRAAGERLPNKLVYAGSSLGAMPAQMLAQTRPGAKGVAASRLFPAQRVRRVMAGRRSGQIHMMEADEWVLEGDLDAARELAETVETAELFLYPGDRHLFTESSLPAYDERAGTQVEERALAFLDRV